MFFKSMIRASTKQEGSATLFQLKDNLTTRKVKDFARRIQELIDSDRVHLIIDLSEVQEVCLLGLVAISSAFNKCRQNGGALKVCNLTTEVRQVFRETNLINTVEVFDTALDALKSFQSQNLLRSKKYSGSFYIEERNAFFGWDRLPPARNNQYH